MIMQSYQSLNHLLLTMQLQIYTEPGKHLQPLQTQGVVGTVQGQQDSDGGCNSCKGVYTV